LHYFTQHLLGYSSGDAFRRTIGLTSRTPVDDCDPVTHELVEPRIHLTSGDDIVEHSDDVSQLGPVHQSATRLGTSATRHL
jgi:hypothetical protein